MLHLFIILDNTLRTSTCIIPGCKHERFDGSDWEVGAFSRWCLSFCLSQQTLPSHTHTHIKQNLIPCWGWIKRRGFSHSEGPASYAQWAYLCASASVCVGVSTSICPICLCTSLLFGAVVMLRWAGGFTVHGLQPVAGDNKHFVDLASFTSQSHIRNSKTSILRHSYNILLLQPALLQFLRSTVTNQILVCENPTVRKLALQLIEARRLITATYEVLSDIFN